MDPEHIVQAIVEEVQSGIRFLGFRAYRCFGFGVEGIYKATVQEMLLHSLGSLEVAASNE